MTSPHPATPPESRTPDVGRKFLQPEGLCRASSAEIVEVDHGGTLAPMAVSHAGAIIARRDLAPAPS